MFCIFIMLKLKQLFIKTYSPILSVEFGNNSTTANKKSRSFRPIFGELGLKSAPFHLLLFLHVFDPLSVLLPVRYCFLLSFVEIKLAQL